MTNVLAKGVVEVMTRQLISEQTLRVPQLRVTGVIVEEHTHQAMASKRVRAEMTRDVDKDRRVASPVVELRRDGTVEENGVNAELRAH